MSDKNEMAQDRTDWAEDRTVMANERTFAGWMRTGMAAVALALGLRALFNSFQPEWIPKAAASLLIFVAIFIFWSAWRSARETVERLDDHAANGPDTRRIGMIAGLMAVSAAVTGIILLFL
ncbi:DUF202 domain-containing protein [Alphaproteobacteria bacterium GH1-50]|uniref:DUF202 domain-containing protein n=1 Tax=Kangsaoukella pontilimi TaxID=2691042 RepID=A0A7C9MXL8_9RHOB|nr:DUF202 domain-containing protein [Kangsaoukella pontilimi]MXQ08454.1 DUF202 domain-containing protein [Kangsaoukella pontilimi]